MKCPLCSRLYYALRFARLWLTGKGVRCRSILESVPDAREAERVATLNSQAPSCACEEFRTSCYSPYPVSSSETIFRFVFHPTHFNRKGDLKDSLFSHVFNRGCSIQRDLATSDEIAAFVRGFLDANPKCMWKGVVTAKCAEVRGITINDGGNRSVCVYDTGEKKNPAHAELFKSQFVVEEADGPELRVKLFKAFKCQRVQQPSEFMGGVVWGGLPNELRVRS